MLSVPRFVPENWANRGSGFASTVLDEDGMLVGIVKICRDHSLLNEDRRTLIPGDLEPYQPEQSP